ncbi:MAG: transcriptional repressor [Chromatiaceae bacterium]|nr:transcriptional repressor [Gammaproteobacteria bacterium]MCP5305767.1 transcriptional repressor [Chromatiaceae bacterium]MCP5312624.1 transcriptional repressor [Chromatiaceae bacterium]
MSHDSFPDSGHDHRACVQGALRDAETLCARRGVRLTPARRRVLELIWQSHRPSGAYDLLERLAADGHRPSPPTVYRALDFLLRQGLVHRVSSRNAFVGCNHPGDDHMAQLFICDRCDVAFEQADGSLNRRIRRNAMDLQFKIRTQTVEIAGLCPRCAGRSDGA